MPLAARAVHKKQQNSTAALVEAAALRRKNKRSLHEAKKRNDEQQLSFSPYRQDEERKKKYVDEGEEEDEEEDEEEEEEEEEDEEEEDDEEYEGDDAADSEGKSRKGTAVNANGDGAESMMSKNPSGRPLPLQRASPKAQPSRLKGEALTERTTRRMLKPRRGFSDAQVVKHREERRSPSPSQFHSTMTSTPPIRSGTTSPLRRKAEEQRAQLSSATQRTYSREREDTQRPNTAPYPQSPAAIYGMPPPPQGPMDGYGAFPQMYPQYPAAFYGPWAPYFAANPFVAGVPPRPPPPGPPPAPSPGPGYPEAGPRGDWYGPYARQEGNVLPDISGPFLRLIFLVWPPGFMAPSPPSTPAEQPPDVRSGAMLPSAWDSDAEEHGQRQNINGRRRFENGHPAKSNGRAKAKSTTRNSNTAETSKEDMLESLASLLKTGTSMALVERIANQLMNGNFGELDSDEERELRNVKKAVQKLKRMNDDFVESSEEMVEELSSLGEVFSISLGLGNAETAEEEETGTQDLEEAYGKAYSLMRKLSLVTDAKAKELKTTLIEQLEEVSIGDHAIIYEEDSPDTRDKKLYGTFQTLSQIAAIDSDLHELAKQSEHDDGNGTARSVRASDIHEIRAALLRKSLEAVTMAVGGHAGVDFSQTTSLE